MIPNEILKNFLELKRHICQIPRGNLCLIHLCTFENQDLYFFVSQLIFSYGTIILNYQKQIQSDLNNVYNRLLKNTKSVVTDMMSLVLVFCS